MAFSATRGNRLSVFLCFLSFVLAIFLNSARVSGQAFACDVVGNPALAGCPFCDKSLPIDVRVADLVKRLTLKEKVGNMVDAAADVSRLGIPRYEWWSEALHGVSYIGPGTRFSNVVPGATSFPMPILTAASFNTTLFQAIGKVVSTEARAMYNVGLAGLTYWSPNINIFRDPRWGRGQETAGEDPLLTSKYAAEYVKGLQQTDGGDPNRLKVAACCKHYTVYDVDAWKGVDRYHFNAQVSQQDLDDTFQPPFKSCVTDGNVASVMCSYNQVNGKPTCADPDLLKGIIRGQWKLNGYIVSDCDSVQVLDQNQHYTRTPEQAAAQSILAGLDLNCGTYLGQYAEGAVKLGLVDEAAIEAAVSNNFATLMRLGFFDGDPRQQPYGNLGPQNVCTPSNQELAREAARQGIVLLKNNPGSLPLNPQAIKSLAVIGPNTNATKVMIGNYEGSPCNYISPLQGLAAVVPTSFALGCDVQCAIPLLDDARKIAASADATVLVVGANQAIEAEGLDRDNILLPGQQQVLVSEVAKVSKGPVVLVIMSGGGMDVSFAKTDDKIKSILWVGYPGEAGGAALADVIFGFHNPSGRLPMTWYPQSYADKVPMTNINMRADPATGYPGRSYRFYTGKSVFSFGDGLSYSTFDQKLIKAPQKIFLPLANNHTCRTSKCVSIDVADYHCQNLSFDVHLSVKNKGRMSGSHTVFLFSSPPAVHNAPHKNLLGFEKVHLPRGSETLVKFKVDVCNDMSVVDEIGNRKVALGKHVLHVGDKKHAFKVRV